MLHHYILNSLSIKCRKAIKMEFEESVEGKDCSLLFLFPNTQTFNSRTIAKLPPLTSELTSTFSKFDSITAVDHPSMDNMSDRTIQSLVGTIASDEESKTCSSIISKKKSVDKETYLNQIIKTLDAANCISYDELEDMRMLPIDRYLLINMIVLGDKFEKIANEVKARTCIPWLVEFLTVCLRRRHEEELRENNSFMLNIKQIPLHKSPKLNRLFDGIYTFKESERKVKFLTKYASAADFFALIVILLRRLPNVLCPIDINLTKLLFSYSMYLPPTVEEYEQRLKKFQHAVLNCDVSRESWYESIISISRTLFHCNERSRQEEIAFSNLVHKKLRKCIVGIYPLIRRNLLRYVLRNIMFETNRCVIRTFLHMRNGFPFDPKYQRVFDKTKSQIISDLAAVVGPNFLQLPTEHDSRLNRILAMKGILWGMSAPVLYRQQKKANLFKGTYVCHDNCLCGYGARTTHDCTKSQMQVVQ